MLQKTRELPADDELLSDDWDSEWDQALDAADAADKLRSHIDLGGNGFQKRRMRGAE